MTTCEKEMGKVSLFTGLRGKGWQLLAKHSRRTEIRSHLEGIIKVWHINTAVLTADRFIPFTVSLYIFCSHLYVCDCLYTYYIMTNESRSCASEFSFLSLVFLNCGFTSVCDIPELSVQLSHKRSWHVSQQWSRLWFQVFFIKKKFYSKVTFWFAKYKL